MQFIRTACRFIPSAVLAASPFAAAAAGAYSAAILSDQPAAYFRLGDDTNRHSVHRNSGALAARGEAPHDLPRVFVQPGAIAGSRNGSAFFDATSRSMIPWQAAINPPSTQPFTVEAWLYPASDQINPGQCPINNRYAYSTSTPGRQGWVFFQRAPDDSYAGKSGFEGVGWNFRMYRGSGGSSGLDVTSQVPYRLGQWTHVAVVYDPVDAINGSVVMYINGVAANTNTWTGGGSGTAPGYAPNTDDHDPSEAVRGPAGLSFGQYNNTASPGSNPYFGGIDEFAFYAKKLSAAQILAHYQNGTNANRSRPYEALIADDGPTVYLRMDESTPGPDVAVNLGDTRAAGLATHTAEVVHPATSALAGQLHDGAAGYHFRNGNATTTIPWLAANNPNAGVPFTFETWLRAGSDRQGGQCPVNNRWVGGTGRTGWVIFQRNPNLTYPASEGHGWNFRMYSGAGGGGQDVVTGTDYTIGVWQHLVVTWEPQVQNGDVAGNGNDQWQGILTAYVDGRAVATNENALYAANAAVSETGSPAADLGIGSYNRASTLGNNPYEGEIDEVAIYNGTVLSPAQILEHYRAGTHALQSSSYASLVLSAGYDGTVDAQPRRGPATYLRFADPAYRPAVNHGTLGPSADGSVLLTNTDAAGPQPPAFPGFEAANRALGLATAKSWVSVNNPNGLNISGRITLEAWVKPAPTQGETARILSHGPPTLSAFLTADPQVETNASFLVGNEVFLRLEAGGTRYAVGSSDGVNVYAASAAVPAGDLGTSGWIHLAGTYDGTHWRLYRNGAEIAAAPSAVGALPVANANWAIGSTGNGWAENFSGAVDEVAIYDRALSAGRIQAHYAAATSIAPLSLAIAKTPSGQAQITWTTGTLQDSDLVTGEYRDVPTASSPFTVPPATRVKFYRLRQ